MANIRSLSQRDCPGDIKGSLALNQRLLLLLEQGQEPECCWKPVLYPDSRGANSLWLKIYGQWKLVPVCLTHEETSIHFTAWKCVSSLLDLWSWAKWRQSPFNSASHFTTTSETPLPVSWQKFTKTWLWRNGLSPEELPQEKLKKLFNVVYSGTASVIVHLISQLKEVHVSALLFPSY